MFSNYFIDQIFLPSLGLVFSLGLFAALFAIPIWTAFVAKRKDRNPFLWFVIGFFMNFFGLIIAYIAPAKTGMVNKECEHCLSAIPATATTCRYCGKDSEVFLRK